MTSVDGAQDQAISLDVVIGFLVATPLFDALDAAERGELVRIMEVQRLQDGEEVFHEGELGDSWYVVFEGQAEVLKAAAAGQDRQIRVLVPGECFGELAILDGSPRSATVRSAGPLTIFRFRRRLFEELLSDGSLGAYKLVAAMARSQAERLRQLTSQVSELFDQLDRAAPAPREGIGDLLDRCSVSE